MALATAVTVAFAYLALRNVDFGELGRSLRASNYLWLAPALVALAVGFFLRAVRWRFLFLPQTRPALWPTTQALLVGQFFNNVLPLRMGDAARIVALHALARSSRAETTGTVVVERFFDVLSLLVLLFLALPWLPEITWIRAAGIMAGALFAALVAAVVILRRFGDRPFLFVLRPLARIPFVVPERVEAAGGNLLQGFVGLRSIRLGVLAFATTLASWVVLGASFWLVMLGFDLGLSPAAGLLIVVATGLSMILPSAPAAVGVFEAAAIVALGAYGVRGAHALSYALVAHALNIFPFIVAGLVVVNVQRGILQPSRGRTWSDERAADGRFGRWTLLGRTRFRRNAHGTGDDHHDVAEPADRHP